MTAIRVRPFDTGEDIEQAARLLAARHARDRTRDARFPARYESPAEVRPFIEEALTGAGRFGVVAESDGDAVVGFAIMSTFLPAPTHMTANFFPPRTAQLGYSDHAAVEGMELQVYREMYEVLAEHFVDEGYFDHNVYISPTDKAVEEAWVSLGFGRALTAAMRGVEPFQVTQSTGVEMHKAGPEDIAVVNKLNDDLTAHHARSPIYWAHLHEADASVQEFQAGLLAQPDVNAHWIAYDNGTPLGMNTFMAPDWITPMLRPEKLVYLYQGIVAPESRRGGVGAAILARGIDWAREQGYEHVALHFAAPNVSGAKFWQAQGFVPIEHRMARHIDERMAWAR